MLIYTNTRSKVKPKQKSKIERQEYAEWCKKHGISTNGNRKKKSVSIVTNPIVVVTPYVRQTRKITSLNTFVTGPVNTGAAKNTYTGEKVIGIAAMHKSNLVPIFTEESARDVSTMRRN